MVWFIPHDSHSCVCITMRELYIKRFSELLKELLSVILIKKIFSKPCGTLSKPIQDYLLNYRMDAIKAAKQGATVYS